VRTKDNDSVVESEEVPIMGIDMLEHAFYFQVRRERLKNKDADLIDRF
jgi:superoxide dismutase